MQVELLSMTQTIDFKTGEICSSLEVEFPGGVRTLLSISEDKVIDVLQQLRSKKDVDLKDFFQKPPPAKEDLPSFGGDFVKDEVDVAAPVGQEPKPSESTQDEDGVSSI